MRKLGAMLLLVFAITTGVPSAAHAEDGSFQTVFKDSFYGGLTGALVGGAILVFRDHPGDHLNYISRGAAIGVIAGAAFGIFDVSTSLVEIEHGKVVFHFPAPETTVRAIDLKRTEVQSTLRLLTVRY
ncbi:MAG TPA: hypothetical protein VI702_05975 [Nitrospiria bacterium]